MLYITHDRLTIGNCEVSNTIYTFAATLNIRIKCNYENICGQMKKENLEKPIIISNYNLSRFNN